MSCLRLVGAAATHPLGMEGWRFAFLMVALVSLSIGGLTLAFAKDPRSPSAESLEAAPLPKAPTGAIFSDLLTILRLPTFLIIVLQVRLPWQLVLCISICPCSRSVSTCLVALLFGVAVMGMSSPV